MEHYGLSIAEGSVITNITTPAGTQFPSQENVGEMYYRSDENKLYVYSGTEWQNTITTSELVQFRDGGAGSPPDGLSAEIYYDFGGNDQILLAQTTDDTFEVLGILEVSTPDASVITIGDGAQINTPSINFWSGGLGSTYDTQIKSTGGTASDGFGTLTLTAATITLTGNFVNNSLNYPTSDGTNGQVLTTNGSGNLTWAAPGATSPLTTKGDVYSYDTDNQRLAVGTNGQVLTADSAEATGLKWADAAASSPLTTKGDLYTYDTDNQRLAVGTNGQVLTADSAEATGVKWADAASGGAANFVDNGLAGDMLYNSATTVLSSTATGLSAPLGMSFTAANTVSGAYILAPANRNSLQATVTNHFGIDMNNSDIIGIGGIFGNDTVNTFAEGINWPTDTTPAGQMDGTVIPLAANWNGIFADSTTDELTYSRQGTLYEIVHEGNLNTLSIVRENVTNTFTATNNFPNGVSIATSTGVIETAASRFTSIWAMDLNNSDIRGVNGVFYNDEANAILEGFSWPLPGTGGYDPVVNAEWMSIRAYQSDLLWWDGVTEFKLGQEMYNGTTVRVASTATGATITGALVAGTNTYPTVQGTNGYVLTTNGSGTLTWEDAAGGSSLVQFRDNSLVGEIYYDYGGGAQALIAETGSGNKFYVHGDVVLDNNEGFHGLMFDGTTQRALARINTDDTVVFGSQALHTTYRGLSVKLGHGASVDTKLETTDTGVDITGILDAGTGRVQASTIRAEGTGFTTGFQFTDGTEHFAWTGDSGSCSLFNYSGAWGGTAERMISATRNGSVKMYFDAAVALETTTYGAVASRFQGTSIRATGTSSTSGLQFTDGTEHFSWAGDSGSGTLYSYSGEWGGSAYRAIRAVSNAEVALYFASAQVAETVSGGFSATRLESNTVRVQGATASIQLNNSSTGITGQEYFSIEAEANYLTINRFSGAWGGSKFEYFKIDYLGEVTFGGNTYPTDDGTNGQVLTTDGSGQTSWATPGGITESSTPSWTGVHQFGADITLNNNIDIKAKNTTGTAYDVVKMTGSNILTFGNTTYTTRIDGAVVELWDSGVKVLSTTNASVSIIGTLNVSNNAVMDNNRHWQGKHTGGTAYDLAGVDNSNIATIGSTSLVTEVRGSVVRLVDSGITVLSTTNASVSITGTLNVSNNAVMDNNRHWQGKHTGGTAYDLIGVNNSNQSVVGNTSLVTNVVGSAVNIIDGATTILTTSASGVAVTGDITFSASGKPVLRNNSFLEVENTVASNFDFLGMNNSNIGYVGSASHVMRVQGSAVELWDSGNAQLITSNSGVDVVGLLTAGTWRADNTQYFYGRNAGNSANIPMLRCSSSNEVEVGEASNVTEIHGSVVRLIDSGVTALTTSSSQVTVAGILKAGTWQANNAQYYTSRNAGNSTNISLIRATSADKVEVGTDSVATDIRGSIIRLIDSGVTVLETSGSNVNFPGTFTSATWKLANDQYILARNAGNSADLALIGLTTSNHVDVGTDSNRTDIRGSIIRLIDSGVTALTTSSSQVTVAGILKAGTFRTDNVQYFYGRNAGDSTDIPLIRSNASDEVEVGGTSYVTEIHGSVVKLVDSGITALTTSSSQVTVAGILKAGTWRLDNDQYFYARNQGDSANVALFKLDTSNNVEFGTTASATQIFGTTIVANGTTGVDLDYNGSTKLAVITSGVEITGTLDVTGDVVLGGDVVIDSIDKNLDLFTRKAMCSVVGGASPTLTNHFGVTSVARSAAGVYELTMTDTWTDSDAARAKIFPVVSRHSISADVCTVTQCNVSSTNKINIVFQDSTPADADPDFFSVTVEHVV